ncbi:MAG: choice-of-anchor I family protein [Thiotrichales bacterium]|nr:choice-of-anchor I family protein [Thiotrichales bacterium]
MRLLKKPLLAALLSSSVLLVGGCELSDEGTDGLNGRDGLDGRNATSQAISLQPIATFSSGIYDESAAEIVAYDAVNRQTFVVNANRKTVDVLDNQNLANPVLKASLNLVSDFSSAQIAGVVGDANSVALKDGLLAVAVAANNKTDNGWVAFYRAADLGFLKAVQVGALPDMLTFSGNQLLVAIEGEPSTDYQVDPEGQVALIGVQWDGTNLTTDLTTLHFTDFNLGGPQHSELPLDKMVLDGYSATNPDAKASVAQSLEPEYIAVNAVGSKAYVTLQENNAVAVIDLVDKRIEQILGLGFKDHSIPGNELDASQKDGVNIRNWPVKGIYMPDTIASMEYQGKSYFLTANEGDDRQDWLENVTDQAGCEAAGYYFDAKDNCVDAFSAKDYYAADNVTLNSGLVTNGGFGKDNELNRLKFSYHTTVVKNGGTNFDHLYAYGGRSFSIYEAQTGQQVFDSGSDFEVITANRYGADFNNDNAENAGDDRSDNKGPEPEALTLGKIDGRTYAFIGLERMGGIMVYDVSNPNAPQFIEYFNNRNLQKDPETELAQAGDLGPEGMQFVPAEQSPNGKPLLVVGNEVSGTTTYYELVVTRFE